VEDYGSEAGDEDEEEDFAQPGRKTKDGKKKVKKSVFADYEDFAHLLEDGLYDDDKEKKYIPKMSSGGEKKRTFSNARSGSSNKRGGGGRSNSRGGHKRPRHK
jgi:hypothetical protein